MNTSFNRSDFSSGVTDVEIKSNFNAARKAVDESGTLKTKSMINEIMNNSKIKFIVIGLVIILIGFFAMRVFGPLIVGGFVLASLLLLLFFWKYRLPLIIKKEEENIRIRVQEQIYEEKEALTRMELEHLERLKEIIRKSPTEQYEKEFFRRSAQYNSFKTAISKIGGKVSAFGVKINEIAKQRPNMDLTQEREAHKKMELFYSNRMERMGQAHKKLLEFRDKIDQAKIKWEFKIQGNEAFRAMNSSDKEAQLQEMLTSFAFDIAQEEFDQLFSRLELDAIEIENEKMFDFKSKNLQLPGAETSN